VARRLAPLLVGFAVVALLGACGGGDDSAEIKDTVRDFVTATNERDGDRLCDDLVTQDYLEKATGATGDQAADACKQQLDLITGLKLRLVSIGEPKVDGDSATVRATIVIGSQRTPRRFVLRKEDGDWKLASGS
jgi:ketosteroid isomerase-like protein